MAMTTTMTTAATATMRAAVRERYCGPGEVRTERVARPVPGPGEVLVRVRAAGLDQGCGIS
ncbi:hypothetical protein [Thermocatellispora tengchongensis]|uniref:hypothetical protein n=1 Tax=Thermocatellispora tengchongensis TaxID=1073253 RepID=UPI00362E241E